MSGTEVSTKLTPVTLSAPGHYPTGLTRTETPANTCCRVKTKPKLNQININMSFLCFINWVLNGTLSVDNDLVFLYVIWLKARQISKNFQLFQNTGQFSATTFKNGYEYKLFILPDSQLS